MAYPREPHPVLNVRNLLIALTSVASMTFGLFAWDAERAFNKLDSVASSVANTDSHVAVISDKVESLKNTADHLEQVADDHEHRITVLETKATETIRLRGPR